jgi:capsular exopolysaccharide synthesis family protein
MAAPAIAAIWIFTVPKYTAKGEIRVRPIIPQLVFRTEDNGAIPFYQSYLNTQVAVMRSPAVLDKVLDQKDVQSTRWHQEQNENPESASGTPWYRQLVTSLLKDRRTLKEKLLTDLLVSPRGATEIIDVSMTSAHSGRDAEIIANAILDQYVTNVRELSDKADVVLYNKLVEEEKSLRSEIESRENVVAGLRKELGTGTPEELITQMRIRLDAAEARLASFRQDLAAAEWEERELWRAVRQDPAAAGRLHLRLGATLGILKADILTLELAAAEEGKQLAAGAPEPKRAEVQSLLGETETRLKERRQELAEVEAQQKELAALIRPQAGPSPEGTANAEPLDRPSYPDDAEWRRLNQELQRAQLDVAVGRERFKEGHPKMIELAKRVEFSQDLLGQREKQLDEQWTAQAGRLPTRLAVVPSAVPGNPRDGDRGADVVTRLQDVRQRAKLLKYQEKTLLETLAKERADFDGAFAKAQTLAKETEAIRYKRDIYAAVRTRRDQKEMERNVPGSIEVLTRPLAPSEPTSDRRALLSAMAFVGALGAGVALAFLRASRSQDIHNPEDFVHATPAPFLGQLPLVSDKRASAVETDAAFSEPIRMVRTSLLHQIGEGTGHVVQITSAEPGAGKSTVAAMLARSLAQCGKKVLLVDTDLRNPSLARRFKIAAEPGLVGALAGQAGDAETIVQTDVPNFSVLPAGKFRSGLDTELTSNGLFEACLARWRLSYDIVLLDSPPLLWVADARILAPKTDGTVMVVREKQSQSAGVRFAVRSLQDSGGTLLGVVFVGSGGHGAYRPYYYAGYPPEGQDGNGK